MSTESCETKQKSPLYTQGAETKFGVHASALDLSKIPDVKLPEPAPDGRFRTLSDYGYTTRNLMETSDEFVKFAGKCTLPVLDVGAAFGETTVAALKAGATVISNEVDAKSLEYIVKRADLTDDDRKRLYLKEGFMPFDCDFEESSLGAVHASRVMHFFTPEAVDEFFKRVHKWLAQDGAFFLITSSPYHWVTPENFYKQYEEQFKAGVLFPGVITDFSYRHPETPDHTHGYNHAMDPKLIYRLAVKNDFLIKRLGYLPGRGEYDYTFAVLVKKDF